MKNTLKAYRCPQPVEMVNMQYLHHLHAYIFMKKRVLSQTVSHCSVKSIIFLKQRFFFLAIFKGFHLQNCFSIDASGQKPGLLC